MARRPKTPKSIETITHDEASRLNIPTAEHQSIIDKDTQSPVRVAYERRNMASLAEREGLRGKVQCIYLDPPYGIKFNSNFQWLTLTA